MPRDVLAAMAAVVHAEAIRQFPPTGRVGGAPDTTPDHRGSLVPSPASPTPARLRSPSTPVQRLVPVPRLTRLLAAPRRWWGAAFPVLGHRRHRPLAQ